ncbi:MAG: GNAT family N-acetyltransferase [Rubrivivax sp.]|nr:GNAT family N-acetyltransferase [Rubrivivax sp.]
MSSELAIARLQPHQYEEWLVLAKGYKAFYKTPTSEEEYQRAWGRLIAGDGVCGLGASSTGRLVGIAHYLFHTSTWTPTVCYLQDLFTAPEARGQGVARALILAIAKEARTQGASRYYWLTQDNNTTARLLYDKVAKFNGFIRYEASPSDA